jgi:HAD superfamily hydrolase (TIGR01490 family)
MAVVTAGARPLTEAPSTTARSIGEGSAGARFAVFDLDRTLLPGSSLGYFARGLADAGLLRRWDLARHAVHQGLFAGWGLHPRTLERICAQLVDAARGERQAEVIEVAQAVAPLVARRLFPGGRWLLDQHIERNDRLILLSAGPQELVEAVAGAIGVSTALGTEAEVSDGRYTGRLVGPFCHGEGKLHRLRTLLGPVELRRTSAYGDATSDLPVLWAVARPVAVNPDRGLTTAAETNRWPIIRLE